MKLAFIGMGNMAYAILKGGCDRGFFNPAHVSAYDINTVRLAEVAAETVELAEETETEAELETAQPEEDPEKTDR